MSTTIASPPVRVYYADRVVVEHLDGRNVKQDLDCLTEFNDLVTMFTGRWGAEFRLTFSLSGGEFRCTFLNRKERRASYDERVRHLRSGQL